MKHRHSGKYRSRTKRGRITYKRRPLHKRPKWNKYKKIVRQAQKKGYQVSNLNRRNLTVDEVDIPEVYRTDGLIIPDKEGKERRDLIFIDDDAKHDYKRKAFSHEIAHQHLFVTKQDDEASNSNNPKIERKADRIGADILGITVKELNSPDVTHNDVREKVRRGIFFGKTKTQEEEREESEREFAEELERAKEEKEARKQIGTGEDPEEIKELFFEQAEALTSGELEKLRRRDEDE